MSNMYEDSVKQINYIVGCKFECVYCKKSFQKSLKRWAKNNCNQCYNYEPHFHKERLKQSLPRTTGDQFIWVNSNCDIVFAKEEWMDEVLDVLESKYSDRTILFQSKDPRVFQKYEFLDNWILATTLETNRWYPNISKAPPPKKRAEYFREVFHPRKIVTIEPIMEFDFIPFFEMIQSINPERVYIGYDTKKCGLREPSIRNVKLLIQSLNRTTKVKTKYIKKK